MTDAIVRRAAVGTEPLDVAEHAALVDDAAAGAVGHVRRRGARPRRRPRGTRAGVQRPPHGRGRGRGRVAAEVAARAPGVRALAVSHRVGALDIGEVALACAVAADHRQAAFTTCAELVDEVKRALPVWKHQVFADGTDEWVNST